MGLLIFTELLFAFGPQIYRTDNIPMTIAYLFLNNLALIYGYYFYLRSVEKKVIIRKDTRDSHNIRLIKSLLILTILFTPIRIKALWDINPFNIIGVLHHIIQALFSPGEVYETKLEFQSSLITYVNMFINIIVYISLSSGLFYYKHLDKKWKYTIIFLLLIEILLPLGQGVRKGILDTILLVFFLAVASNPKIILNKQIRRRLYIYAGFASFAFLAYFIFSNMSRYGIEDLEILTQGTNMYSNVKAFYRNLNPIILVSLCSIQGYACQGYYALSLALQMPYEFCYFLGSSWFGINLSHRIGIDVFSNTYIYRLSSKGIDPTINWHSIYTWLADDLTFVLVPFFIFLIGYFFAKAWDDTLNNRSVFAPPTFFFFSIMVFYSFANNQVFSLMFIPFVTTFILWLVDRKKIICLKSSL